MALRQIRLNDDPILRKKSREVPEVTDEVRTILEDMAETMYHTENGGGLAACQVGILRRLVVIDMGTGLIKLVNPRIVKQSGTQICMEGCLSFPNVWGKTVRPKKVVVEALDENGEPAVIHGSGDMAKCLCHEIDHLDGIVFTDLMIQE